MASRSTSDAVAPDSATADLYGPIAAGGTISGRLRVPGSKSLTQRYFNLALLGRRDLEIRTPLLSEDTELYLAAMEKAGFGVRHGVDSVSLTAGEPPAEGDICSDISCDIFCGNGGTMFRFLTASLTAIPGRWRLDGVARLRERTVAPLISSLRQLGAEIRCLEAEGFAPLEIVGGSLRGGRTVLDAGVSSQFLSAILMAGLVTPEPVTVEVASLVSEPYVDLTFDAIEQFGGRVERDGNSYRVARSVPQVGVATVEPDFSSVAYPAAAAALTGGEVVVEGVSAQSRQGDRGFVDLLARMGAVVDWGSDGVRVRGGALRAVTEDLSRMPDQVPTLAALAPFAKGTTRITNVPHLRIKECDRLAAMATELTRVGADIEELADGLVIRGTWSQAKPPATPVTVDTYGDHRIAMAMALVGLRRPGISIRQPRVVDKSYPDFWRDWETIMG